MLRSPPFSVKSVLPSLVIARSRGRLWVAAIISTNVILPAASIENDEMLSDGVFAVKAIQPFGVVVNQHAADWLTATAPSIRFTEPSSSNSYDETVAPLPLPIPLASDTKNWSRLPNAKPKGVIPADAI